MTIATSSTSLAKTLNGAQFGALNSYFQQMALGSLLRGLTTTLRRCNPVAAAVNPYIVAGQSVAESVAIATSGSSSGVPTVPGVSPGANLLGQLPDDAKACVVIRAVALAGTGTPLDLIVDLPSANVTSFATGGTGPVAGHIGVSPSGDIVTNATDAWTSVSFMLKPPVARRSSAP